MLLTALPGIPSSEATVPPRAPIPAIGAPTVDSQSREKSSANAKNEEKASRAEEGASAAEEAIATSRKGSKLGAKPPPPSPPSPDGPSRMRPVKKVMARQWSSASAAIGPSAPAIDCLWCCAHVLSPPYSANISAAVARCDRISATSANSSLTESSMEATLRRSKSAATSRRTRACSAATAPLPLPLLLSPTIAVADVSMEPFEPFTPPPPRCGREE